MAAAPSRGAAPVGSGFTFQGRLNRDGAPVNDTCDCRFQLWDAATGGTPVGPALTFDGATGNRPQVEVTNGLFTVELDFGTSAFAGDARWVEIEVQCPPDAGYSMLSPRQAVTAAPYALYALNGPGAAPPPSSGILGNWVLSGGEMLPLFDAALDVSGLTLDADGTGRVYFRDPFTRARDCVRILYLEFDGTLLIDFIGEGTLFAHPHRTNMFSFVVSNGNRLGLADDAGHIAQFSRQAQVPAEVACGELQVIDVVGGLPQPHVFGDLVLHFDDLIYNSVFPADQIERFDLDTNTLATPVAPTQNRFVQGKQGLDFWTHCGCGGSPEATRRSLLSVIDTVHTGTDLGLQITIRAGEYLPSTDRLWLHGRSSSTSRAGFLVVNTAGEPDVLERQIDFNREVRGLAFDGTDLWGLVTMATQSIVRISPTTGLALDSFELPDEDVSFTGIELDANHLYVIGTDSSAQGVLYRMTRP